MGSYLTVNAERLEPMEPPWSRIEFQWCRQRKDLTCVVGKQRQFLHLTLPDLPCEVGDTSKWECFKSSKLTSALFIFQSICFSLIFGGLYSTFSFIFFLLQPWEKYKTKQMNNHKICWIWIPILNLYGMSQATIFNSITDCI